MRREVAGAASTPPRRGVWILFVVVYACLIGIAAEGGARLWYAVGGWLRSRRAAAAESNPRVLATEEEIEATGRQLGLDPYEVADSTHPGRWRARPGYSGTVREVLEAKRKAGQVLAVRYIEEEARKLGIGMEETAVQINADGFRGPPIDPGHRHYRILTVGDSCTFGTPLSQRHGYPRALERELRRRGFGVEVINAGVEGYAPADVLIRMEEFRALRPEMTTIYIGWNALFQERFLSDATGLRRYLYSARVAAHAYELLQARFADRQQAAIEAYGRAKQPDRHAPELHFLDDFTPSFQPDVVRIVEEMQTAGSRVVILTLPGLFATDRDPSPRALEIGHLPTFTDNPFVLARMAERYNEALRALARARQLDLVDLDRWARDALAPPDQHFIDSVHLDDPSQEQVGVHLAASVAPLLPESARSTAGP